MSACVSMILFSHLPMRGDPISVLRKKNSKIAKTILKSFSCFLKLTQLRNSCSFFDCVKRSFQSHSFDFPNFKDALNEGANH